MDFNYKKVTDSLQCLKDGQERLERGLVQQKTILSLVEVAHFTGYSKSYLYKLTSTRKIPCYKPNGKIIFFKRTEVEAFLLQNKVLSQEELEQKAATISMEKNFGRAAK